jgi:23S rRNA pseudouridine1911/1915/1917 synthase
MFKKNARNTHKNRVSPKTLQRREKDKENKDSFVKRPNDNKGRRDFMKKKVELPKYKVHENIGLLDFLLKTLKGKSRNNIKSLLSNHEVLVDGAPISQFDFMLARGDEVSISPTPVRKVVKEKSKLDILFEDDDFIAINKPSGLLSIASDKESGLTAYRLMTDHVRLKDKHNRIYVVHRIDKDTSGVLIACKNEALRDALQDQWNDIVTDRGYYALVEGQLEQKEGTIKSWLRKAEETNLMYSSRKPGDGKLSITHYKVIKENENYSLLDVHIDSGRKNQIRVHMKDLGHKIIGDTSYGSEVDPLHRLGLHAYCLEFTNPLNNKKMKFKTKMPIEFEELIGNK